MKTVQDYLDHAEECRALAARARTPEEREMILKMAKTWEELARARKKMLQNRQAAEPSSNPQPSLTRAPDIER
jgi:hypothetical protein